MYPLAVIPMGGLGDSIYQRPFVRWHAERRGELYLRTPWPELFDDLPGVRFVRPDGMDLRTQARNIDRQPPERWVRGPVQAERLRGSYDLRTRGATILSDLQRTYRAERMGPLRLDLPDFGPAPLDGPYAVVRPVTIRKEWSNPARAPDPAYIHRAAEILRDLGYTVVSVADVCDGLEWFAGEPPPADRTYHAGELPLPHMMALVQHASVVVGGVGWIAPAGMAFGVPTVLIGGGNGAHNAPDVVADPRLGTQRDALRWLLPDDYCRCTDRFHGCPKAIDRFDDRFVDALGSLEQRRAA